jgi:hypothetical protein
MSGSVHKQQSKQEKKNIVVKKSDGQAQTGGLFCILCWDTKYGGGIQGPLQD